MQAEYPGAEILILGGGLAGGLVALALCEAGRGAGVTLIESDGRLGGNHTWSFHDTDLGAEQGRLVSPLLSHRWPRHMVRFPGRTRTIETGYATFTGIDLDRVVTERLRAAHGRVLLNAVVATTEAVWDRLRVLAGRPPRGVSLTRLFGMSTGDT